MRLRSPYDREILRFALPALGALAAEPLYILVDTAIVGHLGRSQLAALGIAATVLSVLAMFNFLQYGTTAQVARASGAGEDETAARLGAQALWLSLAVGVALAALVASLAGPIVDLVGADGKTAEYAVLYLRIVALGIPSAFLAIGGQGFLRGVSDLRTPLLVVLAGNVLNVILEVLFVYGFAWGIAGSAAGTAIAQTGMGIGMAWAILRRVGRGRAALRPLLARRLLTFGKFIFLRTLALMSSFVLAGAVVTRMGDAPLAAYDASVRMIWLSVATGVVFTVLLLALSGGVPRIFTSDAEVLAQCALLWPIFALMQPLNGGVFALDGILIGAGDGPYLAWSMAAAFVACAVVLILALDQDWGVRGVWAALVVLMVVRLGLMLARFLRRRWLVTGWA